VVETNVIVTLGSVAKGVLGADGIYQGIPAVFLRKREVLDGK
jgi:acetyltransferase-like isoleucine patch superfamily enzyme